MDGHGGGKIDDPTIDRCFADLETAPALLLAVSGGPDSTALMLAAARWVDRRGPGAPKLFVATVDHGLRPEARTEAALVAIAADRLGLPHAVLAWSGPKPTTRLQERARAARYALLAAHAGAVGATHVVTAHHADDQAETVLFRLGRGSGIGGLAGMQRLSPLSSGLWLARPLLAIPKAALVEHCRSEGATVVEDPANRDPAFARARLREAAPALAALGLDRPTLLRLARRMARADAALETETDRVDCNLRPTTDANACRVDLSAVVGVPQEIAVRLLRRVVARVSPRQAIRLDRLEALADALWAALAEGRAYRGTLAGTRVVLHHDKVLEISRESSRRRGLSSAARAASPPSLRPN